MGTELEVTKRNLISDCIQAFANQYWLKTRLSAEDSTKIIPGRVGHIYEYDDHLLGVMVMPDPPRKRYWGCIRVRLLKTGFSVVLDGDGEGAAVFDPQNSKQARLAIRAAGIKRRRRLSPEQKEQRAAFLRAAQERHLAPQEAQEEEAQERHLAPQEHPNAQG